MHGEGGAVAGFLLLDGVSAGLSPRRPDPRRRRAETAAGVFWDNARFWGSGALFKKGTVEGSCAGVVQVCTPLMQPSGAYTKEGWGSGPDLATHRHDALTGLAATPAGNAFRTSGRHAPLSAVSLHSADPGMCRLAQNTLHYPSSIPCKVRCSAVTEVEATGRFLMIRPQCMCLHTRTSHSYTPASNRNGLVSGTHLHHDVRHPLGAQL